MIIESVSINLKDLCSTSFTKVDSEEIFNQVVNKNLLFELSNNNINKESAQNKLKGSFDKARIWKVHLWKAPRSWFSEELYQLWCLKMSNYHDQSRQLDSGNSKHKTSMLNSILRIAFEIRCFNYYLFSLKSLKYLFENSNLKNKRGWKIDSINLCIKYIYSEQFMIIIN